jgi:phosphomannomutase
LNNANQTKDTSQIHQARHKSIMTMAIMRILLLTWTMVLCTVPVVEVNAWVPRSTVADRRVPTLLLASKETDSSAQSTSTSIPTTVPSFLMETFNSECDIVNRPPSLNILLRSIQALCSQGSDIRGRFVDHARLGSISSVAREIGRQQLLEGGSTYPSLTPLAAHCFGYALADMLIERRQQKQQQNMENTDDNTYDENDTITIVLGQDPRTHGMRLIDALARGAESRLPDGGMRIVYTGIATTPACAAFCRILNKADAAVMVTASHLPGDRNGLKLYTAAASGMTREDITELGVRAMVHVEALYADGVLPPSSGHDSVFCSEWVDWMPLYADTLQQAVIREVCGDNNDADSSIATDLPLQGLKIVLNPGNGAGGFFQTVLENLGADCTCSIHLEPDGMFPNGVPNPENQRMILETLQTCQEVQADLGIMLDTDADRCGFVVPRTVMQDATTGATTNRFDYEALNRNRLIALLGVVFARSYPGSTVVTDSVTSEGLTTFLQGTLGLKHVRYLKGYANVINKAKELTESGKANAALAIETSGHCAMKENDYLDDGTYTAVKIVSLLARERAAGTASLLDLIRDMPEMAEIWELRCPTIDQSLETTREVFDFCALAMERACDDSNQDLAAQAWEIDTDNLEGIRIRTGNGGFMMLRKSLHDPIISLQIEGRSKQEVRTQVLEPLLRLFKSDELIKSALDMSVLQAY